MDGVGEDAEVAVEEEDEEEGDDGGGGDLDDVADLGDKKVSLLFGDATGQLQLCRYHSMRKRKRETTYNSSRHLDMTFVFCISGRSGPAGTTTVFYYPVRCRV